jgi:hypothetical protein
LLPDQASGGVKKMGMLKSKRNLRNFFITGWIAGITSDGCEVRKQAFTLKVIPEKRFKNLIKGGKTSKKTLMNFLPGMTGIAMYAIVTDVMNGRLIKEIKFVVSEFEGLVKTLLN